MGKGKKPIAPATPNFIGIAREQGELDRQASADILDASRINQVNPLGSQIFTTGDDGRTTLETTLSPSQQRIFESSQNIQGGIGEAALAGLGQFTATAGSPLDFSGAPSRVTSLDAGNIRGDITASGVGPQFDASTVDPRAAQQAFQTGLDTSGLAAIPGAQDFGAERQQVIDTLLRQSSRTLDPQFQQQEEALRTRLLNQGVREGTEAFTRAFDQFGRERTDAFGGARDRAILAGGAEQSRLLNNALGVRNTTFGETLAGGQFRNLAVGAGNQLGLATRGQDFGQNLAAAQQGNAEAAQALNAQLAGLGFENEAQQQDFLQQLTNANLTNEGRNAAIQEILAQRQIPQQELASLINAASGGSALPQFGARQDQVVPFQAADILGASQAGFSADLNKFNADQAARNAKKGGATQLAGTLGSAAIFASDKRLKKNIERIGSFKGHNFYVWDWNDMAKMLGVATHPRLGVMANEIAETIPEAIHEFGDGYMAVDYSVVWENNDAA